MDSDNILSLLSSLGIAQVPVAAPGDEPYSPPPATNVLQAAATPSLPAYSPPPPQPAAQPAPVPRQRRSVLDTIGRLADVFAKVGGADALYQPTLDAREDRTLALSDHDRKVQADNIALATGKFDLSDKQNLRLGHVARGLKAIQAGGGDINAAFPELAQRMQLDPETVAKIGPLLASDPHAIDGIIAATSSEKFDQSKYSGSVVYATGPDGKVVAFQPSLDDGSGRNILPGGYTAIEPSKVVDLGGNAAVVGNSGTPKRIFPKTEAPGKAADRRERGRESDSRNSTQITIAGMPARAKPGGKDGTGNMNVANSLLDNIERGFNDLHKLQALPGEGSGAGMAAAAFGRTALGQKIGEQVGNIPAQKRLEIEKDINSLQSEMVKSLPASATRTKFEQEIQRRRMPDPARMSYATAQQVIKDLRNQFAQAQKDAAAELAQKTPVARPKANGGWTLVKVK